MAMMDYGAIAFKNGKLVSTGMFTSMKDTCGFSDGDKPLAGVGENEPPFDGNQFVVLGDERFLVGFYKTYMKWWRPPEYDEDTRCTVQRNGFGFEDYDGWKRWSQAACVRKNDVEPDLEVVIMTVKPRNGYYVARFSYKGDKYKVYFGYGVDYGFYKKTRRVNYYRSPEHFIRSLPYKIKWKLKDFRIWIREYPAYRRKLKAIKKARKERKGK